MRDLGLVLFGMLLGAALVYFWRTLGEMRAPEPELPSDPIDMWEKVTPTVEPPTPSPPQDQAVMGRMRYGVVNPGAHRKVRGKRPRRLDD